MRKNGKKLLSLALALIMVLGMLPGEAWAADGDFINENGVLTKYTGTGGNVVIPNGIAKIGDSAFDGCTRLTSVTIPNSVTGIGARAFADCSNLTSVTIPNSVTSIEDRAFFGCESLTSIRIPDSITSIELYAFYGCSSLTSISIPGSVTSIEEDTFYGCSSLTNVTILDGVKSIGTWAFSGCKSLTSICIPNSVISITLGAFVDCSSLTDVYYAGTENQWKEIFISSSGNEPLTNATIHYNSTGPSDKFGIGSRPLPGLSTDPTESPEPTPSVTPKEDISFSDGSTYSVKVGSEVSIKAIIPDVQFLQKNSVTWTSDNEKVASVTPESVLNAVFVGQIPSATAIVKGVSEGTATLTVSIPDGRKASCEIIVEPVADAYGTCGAQGDNLVWKIKDGVLTISGTGDMKDYGAGPNGEWIPDMPTPWEPYDEIITTVVVEDGVEGIGSDAFTNLYACKSITLGAGVDSVRRHGIDRAGAKITFTGDAPSFIDTHFATGPYVELYYDDTRDVPNWRFIVNRNYYNDDENELANVFWIPIQNVPNALPIKNTFAFTNHKNYLADKYGYYISKKDFDKLIKAAPNKTDKENLKKEQVGGKKLGTFNKDGKGKEGEIINWTGSCYGMSAIVAAVINGAFFPTGLGTTSNDLHSLGNSNGEAVSNDIQSFINFYHFQQKLKDVMDQKANFRNMSQKDQLTALRQLVEAAEQKKRAVLIEFDMAYNGKNEGHAIVGYAVQYGRFSLTVNSISQVYNGRIMVYDPFYPGDSQRDTNAIYFNDTTFAIPGWNVVSLKRGIDKNTGDTGTLTGLLSIDNYINAIDFNTGKLNYQPGSRSVAAPAYMYTGNQEFTLTIGNQTNKIQDGLFNGTSTLSDSGAMILFSNNGESNGSYSIALPTETGYQIATPGKFSCAVETDNLYMDAVAIAAGTVSFEPDGKVEFNSKVPTTAYLSLTANDGYHTLPWYTIEANSEDASVLSLELTDDGVVVAGDNLTNTIITGIQGDEDEETVSISTEEDSVLITEKDEKFEILIDADNDGEYETSIETTSTVSDWVNPFTDVVASAWYYDAVRFACEGGLMNGIGSTQFAPDANLSRAQLAQILYNKENKPAVSDNNNFTDVSAGQWYTPAVIWANKEGVVGGYGNGLFGPNDDITREQLAVMLWRYAGKPSVATSKLNFTDANKVSSWALDAIRWATEQGIIHGKGNGILDPKGFATRAEVAQMLMNYLDR